MLTAGVLGIADLQVRRLGLGTLRITGWGAWGCPKDPDSACATLREAVDSGVTFIDTADAYGPETSELLIARALRPYRRHLVIATKGGHVRTGPWKWGFNGRPEHLRAACEGSLKRLGLDCIDLYQLHHPDPEVSIEESVGALVDLQRAGKVRHIGICNVGVADLERARSVAAIAAVQNRCSVASRASNDLFRYATEQGLPFIAYAPLSMGRRRPLVETVAAKHGATSRQVAVAWLLALAPNTLPIPSATCVEHLRENLDGARLLLDEADMRLLTPRGW